MSIEIWIPIVLIAICAIIIVCLAMSIRNRNDQIIYMNQKNSKLTEKLSKTEKAKFQLQDKYDIFYQKYIRLMRAYLIARNKDEIEVVDEIEGAILNDYEELGSGKISATSYIASAMADFYTQGIKDAQNSLLSAKKISRALSVSQIREVAIALIEHTKKLQYTYELALSNIMKNHPLINKKYIKDNYGVALAEIHEAPAFSFIDLSSVPILNTYSGYIQQMAKLERRCRALEEHIENFEIFIEEKLHLFYNSALEYQNAFSSNLTAIPYMSRIFADLKTLDLDRLILSLSWGENQDRKNKVDSLNTLKKEKSEEIERIKNAEYQLAYLLELYPALQDVIDTEFKDLEISYEQLSERDPVKQYLDQKEWNALSEAQRNQLALDRYIESRKKSKWQIGRDYELYCGYCYESDGYEVDYYGSYHGLEDLGRDLIIRHFNDTRIVQCKYWSHTKEIHEKHIMQLYGTVIEFNLETHEKATGVLITNTTLSKKAKEFARVLNIEYKENMPMGEFPRIKCNIGVDEYGRKTKIYHLPFDQQYDATKIDKINEFMAFSVKEAETAGFRRACKWFGSK